jgi:hypothetical protein
MGKAFVGSRAVFRGHDLHADLHDMSWMELYIFGITGRRFPPQHIRLMNAFWVCTSYPEPRVWNNRVAALAGTTRSTGNLAIAAATAVSEASIYGRGIDVRAIDFLLRAREAVDRGESLYHVVASELKERRGIAGYGRPIANGDERIAPLMSLVRELGMDQGSHLKLAFEIEQVLLTGRWRWRMNYASLCAALSADMGMSVQEYYLFGVPAFLAGMHPCFIEASENPEASLFPMTCGHVQYEGVAKRAWIPTGSSAGHPEPGAALGRDTR